MDEFQWTCVNAPLKWLLGNKGLIKLNSTAMLFGITIRAVLYFLNQELL